MIIGKGLIANTFNEYKNINEVLIFASGVSNSQVMEEKEFKREFMLIKKTLFENPNKLFVYFSTCSIYDPLLSESPYVIHKIKMEQYISKHANTFLILRISQILGRSKNKTLVNFLYDKISNNEHFNVWKNSNRNLIAISDVFNISKHLIENTKYHNQTFHIANSIYISMTELVQIFEYLLHKKANCSYINKGKQYRQIPIDTNEIMKELRLNFDHDYYTEKINDFIVAQQKNIETKF